VSYSAARLNAPVRPGGSGKVFENSAFNGQHFSVQPCLAALCGLGLGLGLGGPSVAQGPPKRDARETQALMRVSVLFATKVSKMPGGGSGKIWWSGDRQTSSLAANLRE
jgi:hypothetical protein